MTDQQKVRACDVAPAELSDRKLRVWKEMAEEWEAGKSQPINANAFLALVDEVIRLRQAAVAHASSATVKQNLAVGSGEAIYQVRQDSSCQWAEIPKRLFESPGYAHWQHRILYPHPAPSSEDARDAMRWRKFVSMVDPDKVPGGFNVYLAMTDDVDVWCYCEDDIAELVDQALAAERGDGNG